MEGPDAKNRIVEAVEVLLGEGFPADKLTVRQIAGRAGVGIGTINYHFQSKEKLIFEAINRKLVGLAEKLAGVNNTMSDSPKPPKETSTAPPTEKPSEKPLDKLIDFLIRTSDLLMQHYSLYKLQINYEIVQGDMKAPEYLLPLLQGVFEDDSLLKGVAGIKGMQNNTGQSDKKVRKNENNENIEKNELTLRLRALQLISTMQVMFLNPEAFRKYSGVDIFDKQQRDNTITTLAESVIKE